MMKTYGGKVSQIARTACKALEPGANLEILRKMPA